MKSDRIISSLIDEERSTAAGSEQPTIEDIEKIITNKITKRLDAFQKKIDALTEKEGEQKDEQSNVNRKTDEGSGSIDVQKGEGEGNSSEVHSGGTENE